MSIREEEQRESFIQAPLLSENVLLAIIAAGFVMLHALTAVTLLPRAAPTIAAPSLELMLGHYD
ncbi:hypothetical protein A5906_03485 [Bradyrhizobium sacchari]|uniref:Uncharacterized protein n=1 Tax=Bradyrhizobium sacchari TaxID=1399419 RepID=A0A560KM70_9BRAD|nr:hypothetical protein [Bradyrhizobium sacchari]OPY96339.1 hypothetical protein A5906_03485 [Bradyrhizobium sacchari]TWB67079.1 hypothetical protein FBZ94_101760 [Bradyrhizobium sacchari]TWB84316.1 hypothetical protein FBZ95_101760 [Bradyrhizobium sacchari]